MARPAELKETPNLLVSAFRHFSTLLQDEIELAKAEARRSATRAGTGLALIGVAAIVALTALDVLAAALVAWIAASGIEAGWAAVIVGGGALLLAIVLALYGKSRLSAEALAPERTARNIRADIETIKEATHA
ncbi:MULTISPECIES: phage holin family protein [Tropicimonas]|uniref:Phage holin family protein n=2 Tax=Tropicimonas TaxID=599652 RepID=A0ABW3IXK1_9RHOB|nr:phage holin family protein [Tropicimonas sediminicola]SNT23288.1 Putative Holin-X, holin superfamily III [Tropicimonas sediminicola]